MLMLDAETILHKLPFSTLVNELADKHLEPVGLTEDMLLESEDSEGNTNHFLIRAGWQAENAVGAKVTTIFPRNNNDDIWPSIQAVYVLFDGVNGTPIACLDGTALTYLKTATDSALGAKLLAQPDIKSMMMIGAGEMAFHLITAHCQLHPSINQVYIWNRSAEKAQALSQGELKQRFPEIEFSRIESINDYVSQVGLISCATASKDPLIPGKHLQPGTHVDLVGAFTADMREADDDCMRRARLFVDARETTINRIGEFIIPIANGIIEESDICADLFELCQNRHPGRQADDDITIYKNGGGGHLDLMVAQMLYEHNQSH